MRGRSIAIAAASTVLVSCALISGAGDLTVAPDVLLPEAGAPVTESSTAPDAAQPDGPVTATPDAGGDAAPVTCDEPGLVARWTFDEGSGLTVRDCTSFHHDGQVDGGNWVDGERDGGMAFDGGWVGFGNPPGLQLVGPLTVCAWVRPASFPPVDTARQYVVNKLLNLNSGGWRLGLGRSGPGVNTLSASLKVPDPNVAYPETKGGAMTLNAWSHMCAVIDGRSQSVFVGGVLAASSQAASSKITLTNDELRIGIRGDGVEHYEGAVDDVRIYSRALAAAEIAVLAQP